MLVNSGCNLLGISFWGCPWASSQHDASNPDNAPEVFTLIPHGVDVLLTHGPTRGILDLMEGGAHFYGSSAALHARIMEVKPAVHLHGHVHEQRGVWRKGPTGDFAGGVAFTCPVAIQARPPPPAAYPVQLVANSALKNAGILDGPPGRIVGRPLLIEAQRSPAGAWVFR